MTQEWLKHKLKINNNSIIVKILINKILFELALINSGYKYYSIVDKNLITELRFPGVKIPLKPIIDFIKKNTTEP